MKYSVHYSCGHTCTAVLYGKTADRERRIEWWEKYGVCPNCYREQKEMEKSIGCREVEMPYKQYKTEYADCKTKAGSYNGDAKTIVVYVPDDGNESNQN